MSFLAPAWLFMLLPLGGLACAYLVLQRRRRHHAVRFTNLDLLASVAPSRPGWRRHVAAATAIVGIAALVLALARPARPEEVARQQATVVLVVDVSTSMEATDVAPTRMEAAKTAAAAFVDDLPDGYLVGLVAFDGTARLLATPTDDHDAVASAIAQLRTGRGTAGGDGLAVALDAISALDPDVEADASGGRAAAATTEADAPTATVVLLSDGATTVGQPLDVVAREAVERGIPVTTIAYGTSAGTVSVEGQSVQVPTDEASMEALADTTGGRFFAAGDAGELREVYDHIQSRIGTIVERREILRFFVGTAVVALMAAVAASMYWNARFL